MADRHARRQTHGGPRTSAAIEAGGYGDLHGGLFEGAGGPALIVTCIEAGQLDRPAAGDGGS